MLGRRRRFKNFEPVELRGPISSIIIEAAASAPNQPRRRCFPVDRIARLIERKLQRFGERGVVFSNQERSAKYTRRGLTRAIREMYEW